MYRYITKKFHTAADIDQWLNSFHKEIPSSQYHYSIVGYVAIADMVVITLAIWETKPQDA